MSEALVTEDFVVAEVEDGGSVSEVLVRNRLSRPVLLLEGEEVLGAQQNRVINSTILIAPNSETRIPVSCSEQGRWQEVSDRFADSGVIAPPSVRATKVESVSRSLRDGNSRASDQSAVWAAIDDIASRAGTHRATGAMRDVFDGRSEDLETLVSQIAMLPEQVGCIAIINGDVVGLDCVPTPAVCQSIFPKLVRSYAMEAILAPASSGWDDSDATAHQFLGECSTCEEFSFQGVGLGTENRYDGTSVIGSALVHDERLIHAALHRRTPPTPFPRSYWVRPGRLLAGYYPGDVTKEAAAEKISSLLDAGIQCVVNLVEEDEKGAGGKSLRSYATLLAGEARSRHIDVSYVRIPIPDVSVPSVSTMRLILGAIDSALDEGRPTYVHCWGGRGRTGTVVGCYLARHRTETDEDALTTIARLRRGEETGSKASPETVEQCDMVRAWAG